MQLLYLVGLPFPLRWGFRAWMQLLHQHTRRKIRLCRATDVPRRLPSQLRSHKLSLAAGMDAWAFLETQSYYGDMAVESGGFFADAAAALDAASGAGGSVVDSELEAATSPFTPRTPHGGPLNKVRSLRRFRWRRARAHREGGLGPSSGRQRLRVRLVKHGAWMLGAVAVVLVAYLVLLHQLLPSVAQPLTHRLAALLQTVAG